MTPGPTAFSRFTILRRGLGAPGLALSANATQLGPLGLGERGEDSRTQFGLRGDAGGAAGGGGEGSDLFPVGAALASGLAGDGADFSPLGCREIEAASHGADVAHLASGTPASSGFRSLVLTVSLSSVCSLSSAGSARSAGSAALAVARSAFPRFFGGPPVLDRFGNVTAA